MKSVVVGIGNTDDKLSQKEWSRFIGDVSNFIDAYATQIHFHGYSCGAATWQNTAWYFDIADKGIKPLKKLLASAAFEYRQDSIAWLEGETEFIEPPDALSSQDASEKTTAPTPQPPTSGEQE